MRRPRPQPEESRGGDGTSTSYGNVLPVLQLNLRDPRRSHVASNETQVLDLAGRTRGDRGQIVRGRTRHFQSRAAVPVPQPGRLTAPARGDSSGRASGGARAGLRTSLYFLSRGKIGNKKWPVKRWLRGCSTTATRLRRSAARRRWAHEQQHDSPELCWGKLALGRQLLDCEQGAAKADAAERREIDRKDEDHRRSSQVATRAPAPVVRTNAVHHPPKVDGDQPQPWASGSCEDERPVRS